MNNAQLQDKNLLIFTRTMQPGGTEKVVLQLCEILKPVFKKIVVCSCGGTYEKLLDEMGIKHYCIPDIEQKNPKIIVTTAITIKKIVEIEKITVIHTHHRMAAFYVSLLRLYKNCIFINTSHNTFSNKRVFTRFAYKHSYIVACGEMVKKNLITEFKIPIDQITVIHNAVKVFEKDVVEDNLLRDLREKGYFLIGNIGRLSKQKGFEYFIQSMPLILEKCPCSCFLIIGSGKDENRLMNLVNKMKLSDKVYFMGYREDIQNLILQLDLVVLSSLWEGLPLTPIEAFSVGKTVIATAVDGTVEIIEDGKNGFLIETKQPHQIADKAIYLIQNEDKRKEMENAAKKRYQDEFSFQTLSDRYITYYKEKIIG